jgi:acid stress-induced BolA-like protein IbaG/YrbA
VYDAAGDLMQREIHALTMVLQTPEEAGVSPSPL